MRFFSSIVLLVVTLIASPLSAQQWLDYTNREYRFSINFPAEPDEEDVSYFRADGTALSARSFVAATDNGRYAVTVIVLPDAGFDANTEIEHAVDLLSARGEIRYEGTTDYDDIPVYELNMIAADGNQIMATIILYEQHLYFVEAEVSPEMAPPLQFQQSVSPLDANGSALLQ